MNHRALADGADLVIHSATKYLGGHNDLLCGVVLGGAELVAPVRAAVGVLGGVPDAHSAYLLLRGLKTLALRMERHNANGLAVARFLEQHPRVRRVWYPGLPSHPDHAIAARTLSGFGGVVTFEVDADLEGCMRFVDACRIPYIAPSLGGVESLIEMPVLMSFWDVEPGGAPARSGITDSLVRLSCGIEDADDLVADLEQALREGLGERSQSWPWDGPERSIASSLRLEAESAAVAAEAAVARDHAVAGDDQRDRIRAVGGADRAHRVRLPHRRARSRRSCGSRRRGSRAAPARRRAGTACRAGRAAARRRTRLPSRYSTDLGDRRAVRREAVLAAGVGEAAPQPAAQAAARGEGQLEVGEAALRRGHAQRSDRGIDLRRVDDLHPAGTIPQRTPAVRRSSTRYGPPARDRRSRIHRQPHAARACSARGTARWCSTTCARGASSSCKDAPLVRGDVRDASAVARVFAEHGPFDGVLHFAALLSVPESVAKPLALLLEQRDGLARPAARRRSPPARAPSCSPRPRRSTGIPRRSRSRRRRRSRPSIPYGATKAHVERMLADAETAHGLRWAALRYFNACGADPDGDLGECHDPETHLIPVALEAAAGLRDALPLYGTDYPTRDGTCVRDYVHVSDLATAHVLALEALLAGRSVGPRNLAHRARA